MTWLEKRFSSNKNKPSISLKNPITYQKRILKKLNSIPLNLTDQKKTMLPRPITIFRP